MSREELLHLLNRFDEISGVMHYTLPEAVYSPLSGEMDSIVNTLSTISRTQLVNLKLIPKLRVIKGGKV